MAALPVQAPASVAVIKPAIPIQYSKQFPNAQGVAANTIATATIPPAGTLYETRFRFLNAAGAELTQAQVEAECTAIRIRINGDLVVDASTAELNVIQNYYAQAIGAGVDPGIVCIDWCRNNLNLPGERTQYAIGTQGINSIEIQFVTAATPNLSSIEIYCVMTDEVKPVGAHLRILPFPQSFGTASMQELSTLPTTPGTAYLAFHVGLGAGTLKDLSIIIDDVMLVQTQPLSIIKSRQKRHFRTPQTGYVHQSFDLQDEVRGFLSMVKADGTPVQDYRTRLNWTVAPANYRVITERVFDLA